jgi:chromosome segregation protein
LPELIPVVSYTATRSVWQSNASALIDPQEGKSLTLQEKFRSVNIARLMKIKRLDIAGFKSFVDRTTLDFQQKVTAVVGPNGCGKSNIVDAIRWVMGEQSPKNLRGRNMEDVIFGGSESRKPVGMAEVSLVFSTEDGRISAKYLNYNEIQITRRLYRNGESEYLLNKTPCRLLDIAELFMDTGAGARAYSIIEQGKIGMILQSKPEERRFLIEEAAGVVKYKSRKQIALKKIDVTRQNLLRIGDIVSEIKRQLNALQRQAKKAEKYRGYREELKEIELLFTAKSFRSMEEEKCKVEEELAGLKSSIDILAAELESGDLSHEEMKLALLEIEKSLAERQEEIYRIKGDMRNAENLLEFRNKELQNLERQLARFSEEANGMERQFHECEAELKSLEQSKDTFSSDMEGEEHSLTAAEQALEEKSEQERELAARLEKLRRELLSVLSEISQFNNQHAGATKRLGALEESLERSGREITVLREKLAVAKQRADELESARRNLSGEKEKVSEGLNGLKSREAQLKERSGEVNKKLGEKREMLNKKESRLHSLQELEAQFAGYGRGIRSLFLTDRFKGIFRGILADFVETEEIYELALESVLAERLQYVVCSGENDALTAIKYLKETSGGRCSFIVQGRNGAAVLQGLSGMVRLLDKVYVRDEYKAIVDSLLENVLIVDDLPTAFSLSRLHPGLTFVTVGGDMVSEGGIMHGGSTESAGQGLVHKKREIKILSSEVSLLKEEVKGLESLCGQLREELSQVEEELVGLRQSLHQKEIDLINNDKDLQRELDECQRLEERIVIKGMEEDQLREERESLLAEIEHADRQRALRDCGKVELEKQIEELQELLRIKRLEIEVSREMVTGLKVRSAALKEKKESNLRAIKQVEERIGELRAKIANQKAEVEKGYRDKEKLLESIKQSDEDLKRMLAGHLEAEAVIATEKEKYECEAEKVQENESRLKELRGNAELMRRSSAEKSLKFSELSMHMGHMENSILDKYRLDIASIMRDYADKDCEESEKRGRQAELQAMVDEMGEVNLMAIEEFRELEERYDFMSAQKSDLEDSMQGLQQAIQRINRTTRKRFFETFQKVNEKFQEVFPRLFCGGKAELKLTNEEDLLEAGIDIIIQPPGKKLQNISLLSGGEKALTAVALMFSIFLIKPTPFCLLDEVDAPLDEANIRRFTDMIRELGESSQFIMITHNKTSMSCADCLYGVTMEDPGVSRLVSVKLQ